MNICANCDNYAAPGRTLCLPCLASAQREREEDSMVSTAMRHSAADLLTQAIEQGLVAPSSAYAGAVAA